LQGKYSKQPFATGGLARVLLHCSTRCICRKDTASQAGQRTPPTALSLHCNTRRLSGRSRSVFRLHRLLKTGEIQAAVLFSERSAAPREQSRLQDTKQAGRGRCAPPLGSRRRPGAPYFSNGFTMSKDAVGKPNA
jgi:hypothetical protein